SITINRSPLTPPRRAALPFPDMESCIPSATPAGIRIGITSSSRTMPSPLQWTHFRVIDFPSPLQVGQVEEVCICPRMVLVTLVTTPDPLQVGHVEREVPFSAPLPLQ